MEVGSGLGKSFIITYEVAMLIYTRKIDRVIIVYSEQEIRDSEAENRQMISTIAGG